MAGEFPPTIAAGSAVLAPRVEEIAQILAPHPIFARFDRASLLAVAAKCGFATYPAGATFVREGDPGSFACVILEGEVDVFVELLPGKPPRQARQIATGAIAAMVGSIVLSRAVGAGKLSDRILDAGRKTAGGRIRPQRRTIKAMRCKKS